MEKETGLPIVWYFADPMCSWCWGFSPVITQLRQAYANSLRVSLNMGGLRPGTRTAITDELRNEILHHWESVNQLTGQPFKFENAMPKGFIYDTEPACRAVLAFAQLQPTRTFDYFSGLQAAFYVEGQDITRTGVLARIAADYQANKTDFENLFESDKMAEATQRHFLRTRKAGIGGFPTLVWQYDDDVEVISAGYQPYESLSAKLDRLLAKTSMVN